MTDGQAVEKQLLIHDGSKPLVSECNALAAYLLAFHGVGHLSVTKLKKAKFTFKPWSDGHGNTHTPKLSFDGLSKHLQETRSFDYQVFSLPPLIGWLDQSIPLGSGGASFKIATQSPDGLGSLKPTVHGYGGVWSSFQSVILQNIVTLHGRLLSESENAIGVHPSWMNDLRSLINECVSAVEITLHHCYNVAKFSGAKYGLTFNEDALGSPVGRPIIEKLNWIYKLTQKDINAGSKVMEGFRRLRELRNHLNHFDPPCFAFDVPDVALWLNSVPDVGRLLWCIRRCLNHPLNKQIVEVITLRRVIPAKKTKKTLRADYSSDSGYGTCRW